MKAEKNSEIDQGQILKVTQNSNDGKKNKKCC